MYGVNHEDPEIPRIGVNNRRIPEGTKETCIIPLIENESQLLLFDTQNISRRSPGVKAYC